jgi:hypothetical protein
MKIFLIIWGIGFLISLITFLWVWIFRSDNTNVDFNDFIGFIGISTIGWPMFLIMFIKDRMWEFDITKMPDQK